MNEQIQTKGVVEYDISGVTALAAAYQGELTAAKEYIIDSDSMLELAGEDLRRIKTLQKAVEAERTEKVKPFNGLVSYFNEQYRTPANYLKDAETTLKSAIDVYLVKKEREAQAARIAAEAAARQERERQAAIQAQREAEAQEAAKQAQAAIQEAEQAAAAGDVAAAVELQNKAGDLAAAAHISASAANEAALTAAIVTTTALPPVTRVAGISARSTYKAQVDDLLALVKAVAAGEAPIEAITANDKFLGAQAKAFKKVGQLYPGVTAVVERGLSARAA